MKRIIVLLAIFGFVGYNTSSADKMSGRFVSLKVKATGYCPCSLCCENHSDYKTATGRNAFLPGVAVDPRIISLGSRVDIPSYKRGPNKNGSWILADDVGGSIKGYHIDVRFKTHQEAKRWGTRIVKIRVWK